LGILFYYCHALEGQLYQDCGHHTRANGNKFLTKSDLFQLEWIHGD
jgi:hypothetical protein